MTHHLDYTCYYDEPDDDPGDPMSPTFLDVLVNDLELDDDEASVIRYV